MAEQWICKICKGTPMDQLYVKYQFDCLNQKVQTDANGDIWVYCKNCKQKAHDRCVFRHPDFVPKEVKAQYQCCHAKIQHAFLVGLNKRWFTPERKY